MDVCIAAFVDLRARRALPGCIPYSTHQELLRAGLCFKIISLISAVGVVSIPILFKNHPSISKFATRDVAAKESWLPGIIYEGHRKKLQA